MGQCLTHYRGTRLPASLRPLARATGCGAIGVAALLATGCLQTRPPLAPCLLAGVREVALCGSVLVYENRATRTGRRIPLRVVVLPARQNPADRDPVVFLTGGPGMAATADADFAARIFAPLHDHRDIVLVDQRGTGHSMPLECHLYDDGSLQSYVSPMFPVERVRACRRALESVADLTQYTTARAADDLADVLGMLGYAKANIVGISYGSRAALVFLRHHPERARTVVVQGVLPPDKIAMAASARGATLALDSAIAMCAKIPACQRAAPSPRHDIDTVLAQLRASPATVTLWNWRGLRRETVTITARSFAERVFFMLYAPGAARSILPLIHEAARGDWAPFARRVIAQSRSQRSGRSIGMMLSVLCTDDAPRLAGIDTARLAAGNPLGIPVAHELLAACAEWPRGLPGDTTPVVSSVPVLLLSGARDPVTPPDWADSAAATLSRSIRLVDSSAGHGMMTAALDTVVANFIIYQHGVAADAPR
jgi:pimeloyl-ACP methyl ester carboxylesterase